MPKIHEKLELSEETVTKVSVDCVRSRSLEFEIQNDLEKR